MTYVKTVVEQTHARTLDPGLEWRIEKNFISARPTEHIYISIYYTDVGPDSAAWEYVAVGHPVGNSATLVGRLDVPRTSLYPVQASGLMLDQLTQVFNHVLLEPRKKQFEAALQSLLGK